jgi:hypothetical protein
MPLHLRYYISTFLLSPIICYFNVMFVVLHIILYPGVYILYTPQSAAKEIPRHKELQRDTCSIIQLKRKHILAR